ncbi:ABC transporter substrate-binding protein [Streptomyces sp. CNQ-509]|uniref:N-acetylglucosamine/diacetylchitobiose ABC transporter substrate-binding protein n=1 Tax=Streptomyces sp. CNQ-509 TaxID=444103 RepID=UPI00062DDCFD|nr:N-acetylglucosamine/diacetylchitobiose ABC transporter substrate-binding protein [Streptomyces sp. CNQ-509]AKH85405.1 ABC transporter substrate-binding protein [Streptomyces sp. CNQ-509]
MGSTSEVGRRDLVKQAMALGLISVPTIGALTACASGGDDDNGGGAKGEKTEKNPLGVDKNAPLELLIFDGGFGTQYVEDDAAAYQKKYAKVTTGSTVKIQSKVQGRMAAGDPPDVINNSGDEAMDVPALIGQGQLADMTPLLNAPSIDAPSKTVAETLRPGTVEMGQYGDEKCYRMNIAYSVFGIWYSQKMLDDHGWEYPKTWDDMLAVCAEAKKAGIAGWTYTGVYPQYLGFSMLPMIGKVGGAEVLDAIDNFEPNAWKHDSVKSVLEAHYELYAKGYVLKGSGGWKHTESQTKWTEGKALFIPNGSWVENEAKDTTPDDFQMTVSPSPNLDSSDAMPFETIWAQAGEPYIVPAKAKNVNGGLEFLRHMLTKESAAGFTKLVSSLASVQGSEEGLELGTGLTSAIGLMDAAGENFLNPRFPDWYPTTWREHVVFVLGDMMKGDASPGEAVNKIQQIADDAAKDDSIKKYKH